MEVCSLFGQKTAYGPPFYSKGKSYAVFKSTHSFLFAYLEAVDAVEDTWETAEATEDVPATLLVWSEEDSRLLEFGRTEAALDT